MSSLINLKLKSIFVASFQNILFWLIWVNMHENHDQKKHFAVIENSQTSTVNVYLINKYQAS